MAKKKSHKKKISSSKLKIIESKKSSTRHFSIFLFIVTALVLILAVFLYAYENFHTPKTVLDSPKHLVKKLPADVKKQILTASPSATFRVPILLYHYVEYVQDKKDTIRESLNIDPYTFEQQVITLKNAGYTFMTAKELGDVLDGKMQLPKNPILLTFDDGHWDFYTDVLPILKKYNIKATAYIISGFIGGSDFMSMSQLQGVEDSNLVDVGAHTVHHYSLRHLSLTTVENEVDMSKEWLEKMYHKPVVSFAYPNGSFDDQAVQVVKNAGFKTAVSTVPGILQNQTNRYFLYRLRPGHRIGVQLLTWLSEDSFRPF